MDYYIATTIPLTPFNYVAGSEVKIGLYGASTFTYNYMTVNASGVTQTQSNISSQTQQIDTLGTKKPSYSLFHQKDGVWKIENAGGLAPVEPSKPSEPYRYFVKFLLPNKDNFADTTPSFIYLVNYRVWEPFDNISDMVISITNTTNPNYTDEQYPPEILQHDAIRDGDDITGTIKFTYPMPIGQSNIKVEIKDKNGNVKETGDINVARLSGIVDEDNDGIDDRTQLPVPRPPQEPISQDGLIDSIKSMFSRFNEVQSSFGEFNKFFGTIFGFLPTPLPQLIYSAITFALIMFFVKIVRG